MPCQLCGAEKIYSIQSHYAPKSITKETFGESDKEEIYSITPQTGEIEVYKGRQNPTAVEGDIKPLPNADRGIFCRRCEDAFGKLESICQPPLNDYLEDLENLNFKPFRVKEQLKAFEIPIKSNIMLLFFYSVVWRLCLKNQFDVGNTVLSSDEYKFLQEILLTELFKEVKQIESSDFSGYPRLSIFSSKLGGIRSGWVSVSPYQTNPELFFLGKYHILYFRNDKIVDKNIYSFLGIPSFILNPNINLQPNINNSIIGVVPAHIHAGITQALVRKTSDDMKLTFYTQVAKHRKINLNLASKLIHEKVVEIRKQNPDNNDKISIMRQAVESLCS